MEIPEDIYRGIPNSHRFLRGERTGMILQRCDVCGTPCLSSTMTLRTVVPDNCAITVSLMVCGACNELN